MKSVLLNYENQNGYFPPPDGIDNLKKYIDFDDWKIFGLLKEGYGGDHGTRILNRHHDKCIYQTNEVPNEGELNLIEEVYDEFKDVISFADSAEKSWYKTGKEDIPVLSELRGKNESLKPLSAISSIVAAMKPIKQRRLYVKSDLKKDIKDQINEYIKRRT